MWIARRAASIEHEQVVLRALDWRVWKVYRGVQKLLRVLRVDGDGETKGADAGGASIKV